MKDLKHVTHMTHIKHVQVVQEELVTAAMGPLLSSYHAIHNMNYQQQY